MKGRQRHGRIAADTWYVAGQSKVPFKRGQNAQAKAEAG